VRRSNHDPEPPASIHAFPYARRRRLVPADLPPDVGAAVAAGVNLLVIGSDDRVSVVLEACRPSLAEPVTMWRPGGPLELPAGGASGTLILQHVSAMDSGDQNRLFEWLTGTAETMRVVSTARASLLPAITLGAFLPALYYRLNIVCVDVL
jgi:hypothetical protein